MELGNTGLLELQTQKQVSRKSEIKLPKKRMDLGTTTRIARITDIKKSAEL